MRRVLNVLIGLGAFCGASRAQVDPVPGYKKLGTRSETREAALRAMGGSSVAWGRWWLAGPFPNPGGAKDTATAHAPESLLSAMVAGAPGPEVGGAPDRRGPDAPEWREVEPAQGIGGAAGLRIIDIEEALGKVNAKNAAAYLYRRVEAAADSVVPVALGSDDGVKLWLNGAVVLDRPAERPLGPEDERVALHLKAGVNHLLAKVTQGAGEWRFVLTPEFEVDPAVESALEYRLDTDFPDAESAFYRVITVPVPRGIVAEVGGLDVIPAPDSRPVLCTRRGDVYIIDNAYAAPPVGARWRLFASGLAEPLGLRVVPARSPDEKLCLLMAQRPELTRVVERTGDTTADSYETVSDAWRMSGNYHEYAFGPKLDRQGRSYVTLNLAHTGGETVMGAPVPTRGTAVRIDEGGQMSIIGDGLRSPDGLGMWTDGEMFFTDNQGDYVPTCKLSHLREGAFHGHQSTLAHREGFGPDWKARGVPVPPVANAAVWFPYKTMGQSTSDVEVDTTQGKFGPFAGQFFAGDQTLCTVMRVDLERFDGPDGPLYQGVCMPFRAGFMSGVHRLAFAPDGSMFVGMTDRGWGSTGPKRYGLQRVVWTGRTPFEIRTVRAAPRGFHIEFTLDVGDDALDVARYAVTSWTYEYHAAYGSEEMDRRGQRVTDVRRTGARSVLLTVDALRTGPMGFVHEITVSGLSAAPDEAGARAEMVHRSAYYTLHVIPATERAALQSDR